MSCVTVPSMGELGPCGAHPHHSLVMAKESNKQELLVIGFFLYAFMKKRVEK